MIRSRDKIESSFFIPTALEYENLIRYACAVDRENHLDLVHDSIISTGNLKDAKRFISGRKYAYMSVTEKDLTKDMVTDQVCTKCNEIRPICEFDRRTNGSMTYLRGACKDCRRADFRIWDKKRRIANKKRKKGLFCANCNQVFSDKVIQTIKNPDIRRKRVCPKCRKEKSKEIQKAWRSRNPEKLRSNRLKFKLANLESVRIWKKENREKVNEYNREYRRKNRKTVSMWEKKSKGLKKVVSYR